MTDKQHLRMAWKIGGFADVYARVRADVTPRLVRKAECIIEDTGQLTPADVITMAIDEDIIPKYAFEWLESAGVLPTGTYQKLQDRGFKVQKAVEELTPAT